MVVEVVFVVIVVVFLFGGSKEVVMVLNSLRSKENSDFTSHLEIGKIRPVKR